jgi:L-amino acid N-acyltransferase YncA
MKRLCVFDLGPARSRWLDEVEEILDGLLAWRDSKSEAGFDRRVIVAEDARSLVAVAAHERVEHSQLGPLPDHRYLMVVAVRHDHRRSGLARVLTESIFTEMQADGVRTVGWLVHPRNRASMSFSRTVFPEADETYPPEDKPYVSFLLRLTDS